MTLAGTFRHRPWPPSTAVPPKIDKTGPLEEEATPYYDPRYFYPARLGEVVNQRYQLATKLGFGTSSTVWLARDLFQWRWNAERYVALKIHSSHPEKRSAENELAIAQIISQKSSNHEGKQFFRGLLDVFQLQRPNSTESSNLGLVYEPVREPLWLVKTRFRDGTIPVHILKILLQEILHGLDFLHSDCKVVHADIKIDNIMASLEEPAIVEKSARDEYENPLPQAIRDDRTIYLSRNQFGPISNLPKALGRIAITDYGFSVQGDGPHYGAIQAESLRAPEVILDAGWTYSADIWSLGVMLWDLFGKRSLFRELYIEANYDDRLHLACITALLGPPPSTLLQRGKRTSLFYDLNDQLQYKGDTPSLDFTSSIEPIPDDDKEMFIKFAKRLLTWDPKERSTAKELLGDPFLQH
ncbi:kinase-like protein [Cucurbitaria berberidis CBS 394.84]|uniref:non-specific serine/threonine protein kinase n=1 Tax=Cucurbitaria berberidis CBS 394.84 TaxID=1168544 RepID=A0A9P4GDE4_9PLEO|nr:kinase-like protein [Cucurbitaria berberidis CBS 394.84]KAF1843572.1 kinase-like protein [Cucurbitaria berberidis CBS 394.84]